MEQSPRPVTEKTNSSHKLRFLESPYEAEQALCPPFSIGGRSRLEHFGIDAEVLSKHGHRQHCLLKQF
jgi:hypothetical protein